MKVKVVGYEVVDYESKKTKKQVTGVSLYCLRNAKQNSNAVGEIGVKVWLPESLIKEVGFVPEVGSKVELIYEFDGRYSFLDSYQLVEE